MKINRMVVKVGTSTLTYENGKMNIRRMAKLVSVLSDLKNSGIEIVLVSSGAIGVGADKIRLKERPRDEVGRQAAAAVGQMELMFMYDKLFSEYNQCVGQLLLTRGDIEDDERKQNLINTFMRLLEYDVIPVVNENDCISIDELVFGDNDVLSAITAELVKADMLVIMTDIDGLYEENPRENPDARFISQVDKIDEGVRSAAGGHGSALGTGGMITKVAAAELATKAGIDTIIMAGSNPTDLYKVIDGKPIGTKFCKELSKE